MRFTYVRPGRGAGLGSTARAQRRRRHLTRQQQAANRRLIDATRLVPTRPRRATTDREC